MRMDGHSLGCVSYVYTWVQYSTFRLMMEWNENEIRRITICHYISMNLLINKMRNGIVSLPASYHCTRWFEAAALLFFSCHEIPYISFSSLSSFIFSVHVCIVLGVYMAVHFQHCYTLRFTLVIYTTHIYTQLCVMYIPHAMLVRFNCLSLLVLYYYSIIVYIFSLYDCVFYTSFRIYSILKRLVCRVHIYIYSAYTRSE